MPSNSDRPSETEHPIVYFDGVCGLCNRFVDLLLRVDTRDTLKFAPLQGDTAARRLAPGEQTSLDSIILVDSRGRAYRSEAVLRILESIGGLWTLSRALRVIPRSIRDFAYDVVAGNRYQWFGRRSVCRVPTPQERPKFLP